MIRRLALLPALGLALALAAWPLAAAAQGGPFKIGVLGPLTGPAAVLGTGEVNGIKLRLKELNNQLGGRPVELLVEDDAGDPNAGLTKVQKLVERDRVDVILGPLLSHVVLAVRDYIGEKKVPQMTFVAQPPEAAKHPTSFVPSWNAEQIGRILGDYSVKKLGHKKALIVASKYVFGTRVSDGFRAGFTSAGGTIVKEVYPPLGTADFAPFLTGLPAADVVFSFFPGADAIKYVKARQEYGLTDKLPMVAIISTVEGMLLPAQGDAALGSLAITHYLEEFTIPANQAFVAAYTKEYGKPPLGYYPALGYTLVQILEDALKRTGGKSGSAELVEAIKRVDVQSPQGRFRFDPQKRFPILDFHIVKVVKKDGKLGYETVDVLKEVKPE
jgi:branched-chain amino acid transport system substrate-binding protein